MTLSPLRLKRSLAAVVLTFSLGVSAVACTDVVVPLLDAVSDTGGTDASSDTASLPPDDTGSTDISGPDTLTGPDTAPDTSAPPLPTDYTAYYRFDSDDEDSSGNEHDLDFSYQGSFGTDRWGFAERAYDYQNSGSGIYHATGMAEGLLVWPEVTIALWVRGSGSGNDRRLAGQHDWFHLAFGSGGKIEFGLDTPELGEFFATSNEPHQAETWTFYVGTASRIDDGDGDMQLTLYQNGTVVGEMVATGVSKATAGSCLFFVGPRPNQGPGCNQPGAAPQLNAMLDDVRVYRRALSPSEVKALFGEGGWVGPDN